MQPPSAPILVLDNGAHIIKAAWAHPGSGPSATPPPVQTFRNTIARSKPAKRSFVADELTDECDDFGGLTFRVPMERGILNNWEVEKTVWDRVFGHRGRGLKLSPQETNLLVTEPVFNLPNVQEHYDQMIFEDYDFASYLRCPAPALIPYGADARGDPHYPTPPPECVLVIDAGFSFTHVVPVLRGAIVSHAAKRIDVGGKLLTNYLKELVSFRHWYMMDQTAVMEHAKEQACYVSTRWEDDWEAANRPTNPIVRTFVLPDFTPGSKNKLGYVRTGLTPPPPSPPSPDPSAPPTLPQQQKDAEEEQLLHLCNERFTVPEVLFNPTTIDLNQAGLAETVALAIAALPQEVQGMFWANIVCIGGSTQFPGFAERLRNDLRTFAPTEFDIRVTLSSAPTLSAAASAAAHLSAPAPSHFSPPLQPNALVTRQEYQEGGSNACRRKFARFYTKGAEDEVRRRALAPGWP
ncbi:actin-like protein ARP6 [Rhodotorula diobovata]|uniref:Actin-like protein ARP6 n=1 Tax=Rhodotorula diobovata TaxID=5288 RepID=A0A5C5FMI7_9BASI|nr:actin-like protein ARP6 [Rhodotorula diobovata]